MRSQLAKHQLTEPLSSDELHQYAVRAYKSKWLVLVDLKDITDPYLKQEIINYAEAKYVQSLRKY